METEMIGWLAALLLLMTISMQVWQQWKSGSIAGVSPWLFVGQISASTGFVIYSYLLDNLIFVLTNSVLLLAAIFGQCLYLRNKHREQKGKTVKSTDDKAATRQPRPESASAAR